MTIQNTVFDAALAKIATGTRVSYCSGDPANYAGIAAVKLASSAITSGDGNGDWTIADGDTSGRKLTLAEQANMTPTANGTITYMAIDDGSQLLATNPITSQAVTTLQTWTSPAVKIVELKDPTYS